MHNESFAPSAFGTNRIFLDTRLARFGWMTIFSILAVFAFLWKDIVYFREHGLLFHSLEDDFYYYYVIARRLAETGHSSFDGIVGTNGYHPLWLFLLSGAFTLFGDSLLLAKGLEVGLLLATLYLFLRVLGIRTATPAILAFVVFFWAVKACSLNGMETAPFLLLWTLLVGGLVQGWPPLGRRRAGFLVLVGGACIAARLDAAVFVLPLLLLVTSGRERLLVLSGIALAGAAYAGLNLVIFGLPLPISGSVKSLGAGQLNTTFVAALAANEFHLGRMLRGNTITIALLVLAAPIFWALAPRGGIERRLVLTFVIGTLLFEAKLFFGSSWIIWPWYHYPLYIGVLAYLLVLRHRADLLPHFPGRRSLAAAAGLLILAMILVMTGASTMHFPLLATRKALDQMRPLLRDETVAIGDRAGYFAFLYGGSTLQLEGLVNDRSYLDALRDHADMRALLCRRGTRFLISFEPPLGDYTRHEVETIRHELSGFAAPRIPVTREEEVAVYDVSDVVRDADDRVYLWRLACDRDAAAQPAARPGGG